MLGSYEDSVFINCPFDEKYRPLFEAVTFAVYDCGFYLRCALEVEDSSQVRIDKITGIIGQCRLAIHDVSWTQLDATSGLPRFNMPFELGVFVGAKTFGARSIGVKRVSFSMASATAISSSFPISLGRTSVPTATTPNGRSMQCAISSPRIAAPAFCFRVVKPWSRATDPSAKLCRPAARTRGSIHPASPSAT